MPRPPAPLPPVDAPLRLVVLGDSNAAGEHDPHPDGGFVGWTDRLAAHLAAVRAGPVTYANLAVSGQTATQIRRTQLDRALAMTPDVAAVVAGVNDMLRPRFDAARLRDELDGLHGRLREGGATVVCFTMPDLTRVSPPAAVLRPRLAALNAAITRAAVRHGSVLVDLAAEPMSADPRLWHDDRLHANAEGHRRIAAAVAEALGQPLDAAWRELEPEGPLAAPARVAGHAAWLATHVLPWLGGHLGARLTGEPRVHRDPHGKRPALVPVDVGAIGAWPT